MEKSILSDLSACPTHDQIVVNYLPLVRAVVCRVVKNKMDAEEVVHDVLIKAINKLDKFDPNKASFKTWLATLAKNTSLDFVKSKSFKIWNTSTDQIPERTTKQVEPDLRLQLCKRYLKDIFNMLNETQAKIIAMRFIENKDYTEIAIELGISLEYTRVLSHRAIEKLRTAALAKK